MLACETAAEAPGGVEDLAIFASQLAALAVPARVLVGSVPPNLGHNLEFDLAPHLADGRLAPGDRLVLLAADQLTDAALIRLRRLAEGAEPTARAFGCFGRAQTALGVRARLAYVFGREPELFDVTPADPDARRPAPAFGVPRRAPPPWASAKGPPRLLLVGPNLKDPLQAAALSALGLHRGFRTTVLTDSRSKQTWIAAHGRNIPIFHYGELLPLMLAERTDLCLFFRTVGSSYRLQTLVANLLVSGAPLLDGSAGHRLADQNDAFIPAPPGIVGLEGYLHAEILPNLGRISDHVRESRAAAEAAAAPVLSFLGEAEVAPPSRRPSPEPRADRIIFMPTNGIGLGHAQRCALIAGALDPARPRPVFAAFPSCMRMIKSHGFDVMPLLGRSRLHVRSYEHDLGNFLRLSALSAGAGTLVFDGGYVFDSVYRTVLGGVRGIWIRRGLWQSGQDNSIALDREKAFERVIVPTEAFDELNAGYSRGDHLHPVGPIVQQVSLSPEARAELRGELAERYARGFDRLVVSLLGSGVAADRSMQIQALCGLFERRADTLHLVIVWPSATLEPGWFGWRNSRVVRTQHAAVLAAATDLAITASGYNSFHEVLYNRAPAIFVPQLGPSMDDQTARARAACDRGLAVMVEPTELMKLERLVLRHLEGGEAEALRARLAAAELPQPGTAHAARLIEEVAYGHVAVERDPVPDRTARGR
jgi:hypothetical protein